MAQCPNEGVFFPLFFDWSLTSLSFRGFEGAEWYLNRSDPWHERLVVNMDFFGYVRVNGLIMWMCNNEKEHRIFYMGQLAERNLWHSFFKTLTALAVDHPSHLHDHLPDYNASMSIITKTSKVYSFSTKRQRKIKPQTPFSAQVCVLQREIHGKKQPFKTNLWTKSWSTNQQKHHFIHFLWLQGLGDFPIFSKEAIYQSVAHASPAGAIIRVGEQVHPFKRLGI